MTDFEATIRRALEENWTLADRRHLIGEWEQREGRQLLSIGERIPKTAIESYAKRRVDLEHRLMGDDCRCREAHTR